MTSGFTLILLVIGGSALVAQNAIMLKIRAVAGSLWAPLWLNGLVGLALLSVILIATDRGQSIARLGPSFHWWFVLPGLLGTLFVLASLLGYAQLGAGGTIPILVASQLVAGVVFDVCRGSPVTVSTFLGAGLLIVGAVLVARHD